MFPFGERTVGFGELGGPLEHALFERGVQPPDFDFGARVIASGSRLGDGAPDRAWQAGQALLEDVVHRAVLDPLDRNLFAERAGHEHERNGWRAVRRDALGGQAVERRQPVVGEDHVERLAAEHRLELVASRHRDDRRRQAILAERGTHEFPVMGIVLDVQATNDFWISHERVRAASAVLPSRATARR